MRKTDKNFLMQFTVRKYHHPHGQSNQHKISIEILMINKINKQQTALQKILQIAACIGSRFDLKTVTWVAEDSARAAYQLILTGIETGFIVPLDDKYKYIAATDKIQNGEFRFIQFQNRWIQFQPRGGIRMR